MTKASIINRIEKIEQASSDALAKCSTCRDWDYWWTTYDKEMGVWDPCPLVCPDCERKITSVWFYKHMLLALLPDHNDPRWANEPEWQAKWGSYDWREAARKRQRVSR